MLAHVWAAVAEGYRSDTDNINGGCRLLTCVAVCLVLNHFLSRIKN
jgi:hypothetical protein